MENVDNRNRKKNLTIKQYPSSYQEYSCVGLCLKYIQWFCLEASDSFRMHYRSKIKKKKIVFFLL